MSVSERIAAWLERLARWITWILASVAALLLWVFAEISEGLFFDAHEATRIVEIDRTVLRVVEGSRTSWLTPVAIDLTALGSPTLLAVFTTLVVAALLSRGHNARAARLLASSLGASLLTLALKHTLERARPDEVQRLVEVAGHSYPSGHSLASAAILTSCALSLLQAEPRWRMRAAIVVTAGLLIAAIGASRVYLGVHYPSDVAAGISVGMAWALVIEAFALGFRRKKLDTNLSERS